MGQRRIKAVKLEASRPRNPLVVAARQRVAGRHEDSAGTVRRRAAREARLEAEATVLARARRRGGGQGDDGDG